MAKVSERPAVRRTPFGRFVWTVFLIIEAPLVFAVVGGLAAAYTPPGPFWWTQLLAVGLPYATMLLAVVTVVPFLARHYGWALVHVLLVAFVVWRAVPGSFAAPAPLGEPGPDDLVVTTFNLPVFGPSREVLGDSAVAFVRRTEPDVLLFQDAWAHDPSLGSNADQAVQVVEVARRLPYRLALPRNLASRADSWTAGGTGVPLLVRRGVGVTIVEQEDIDLSDEVAASLAIRTRLRWQGRDFVLYNIHLRSFGEVKPWNDPEVQPDQPRSWIPYLWQYRQVYAQRGAETERLAQRIEAETLPVVIAGDFNSTADNWNVERLRTAGADRVDAFRAVGGRTWGRTYHARRPLVRIDFLLVDPALQVVGADVTDVQFSDHRPVRTHLRWATPAAGDSGNGSTAPDSLGR